MNRKLLALLAAFVMLVSAVTPGMASVRTPSPDANAAPAPALPASPVDETKVPHYFGPYPNWANSQFTLPDVVVTIDGEGAGAAATATVGANGAVTGLTLTDPGSGYSAATVSFSGAGGTSASATATVAASGAVTSITLDAAGAGYTAPTVSFSGGGGKGTMVQVGNSLQDRAYATDFPPEPAPRPVFAIVPGALPTGTLTDFLTWNQATAGASPTPSAGETFVAYVLRPTVPPDQYTVVFASPLLTVPALTDPAVSEMATFPVGSVAVQAGDVIAFYGAGIPVDTDAGADKVSYPAAIQPISGATVTFGGTDFPALGGTRTYSFAASVVDASGVLPLTPATATAYGSVDAIDLATAGTGYSFPTVDIDYPDGVDGVQATAHAECVEANCAPVADGATVTITRVVVDNPGSGYSAAPNVVIRNGTLSDPINPPAGFAPAAATATLAISSIVVDDPGDGYVSAPTVTIGGTNTARASATAAVNAGAVNGLTLTAGGSGYITPGIKKFEDALPGLCTPPLCPTEGKYIPVAVPELKKYEGIEADEYVIGLVQYRTSFSSSLPDTLVRGYIQLETPANADISQHFPVTNELLDGTKVPVMQADGVTPWLAVTPPQWLGPTIGATKDKPVRIVFHNLLPTGNDGDLFLPVDTTLMGSGANPDSMSDLTGNGTVIDPIRNPPCTIKREPGINPNECFTENRATLHLHGGITPWISDGTPHQWITPAGEGVRDPITGVVDPTPWPQGVSVGNVPDMNVCTATDDGCQTFYYTNQQSARLMFYHDHAWGITRLNVYAGEAAGYLITDDTEKALLASETIPADQIPLVVQDRTFVPDAVQLAQQDPTWDTDRWGGMGNFWYHHVYMPAQNPGDPSGMSAYGRWMYGPWFWPPATPPNGPIANPYYNMDPLGPDGTRGTADDFSTELLIACNLDDPATWQYDTDPFCEPKEIPGTPNISVGMEQFNDTPIVNGVAYPTLTLAPKAYRLRVLNAANDRFFNFQWYVGEDATASTDLNAAGELIGPTEVALNQAEVAAAQTDPVVFPTPAAGGTGPDWVVIGTEGGFLPAPVVKDGQQPTTWITDPTRFDVGLVDKFSLLLAPAERADVIVDFSKFAGQTLILYNDAPAAFPARVPSYDYYTGAPDQFPNAAPGILPGYGPNTRTIMQVKIADTASATAFDLPNTTNDGLGRLQAAFRHKADGSGVFESGQHPIIVGQAAYNSAYGTSFAASSDCNSPGSTLTRCDGYVRINDGTQLNSTWGFNTLKAPNAKMSMKLEPKAIHDEMNSTAFDEFGRMTANLGIEAQPPTVGQQNVTLYPYTNPATELIDATNLPKNHVVYDADGLPVSDLKILPISTAADGSQIWRITHNGVDTHPIHFHLYDVQVLNRVAWDNNLKQVDATELGWKDTVRISPLEDTIVALRPIIPELPWELPNAIRLLNPMMPSGFTNPDANFPIPFNNTDPQGVPTQAIVNELVNFGWEYVYHCHILSHEEMDMMRPVSVAMPPVPPDGLTATFLGVGATRRVELTWNDNSITETAFLVERSTNGGAWTTVGKILSPLDLPNIHELRRFDDFTILPSRTYRYRIVAENKIGYLGSLGAFPSMTVTSVSVAVTASVPVDPPVAVVTPASLDFGSVIPNTTSASLDVTVSNTGASDLTVTGATLGGTDSGLFTITGDTCTTVAPAGSCTISVAFAPTALGPALATLDIAHNAAGSPSSVTLTGTGANVAPAPVAVVTPASLDFGSVTTGTQSASQTVTVTNIGTADLVVSGVTLGGTDQTLFSIPTNTCGTVAPAGSCTISVAFTPTTAGAKSGTLSIAHNAAGTPSSVTLIGTGVAPAPLTTFLVPITQDLGNKKVGATTLKTVLVTNDGPNPLIITSATAAAPFSNVTLGTCSTPVAVGKTCKLNVTFAPTSVGNFSVPLVVVSSNATNSPQSTLLTATGR